MRAAYPYRYGIGRRADTEFAIEWSPDSADNELTFSCQAMTWTEGVSFRRFSE